MKYNGTTWQKFRLWLIHGQTYSLAQWFQRVWYCHHNVRVLNDMGYRLSCFLEQATGGIMSKDNYTLEAMLQEHQEYLVREREESYQEGYNDAKEEYLELRSKKCK